MQELAYRAGLSVHGIQKLERGAMHPYGGTARRLIVAACPPGRTQVDRRQPRRGVAGRASAADRSVARPRRFGVRETVERPLTHSQRAGHRLQLALTPARSQRDREQSACAYATCKQCLPAEHHAYSPTLAALIPSGTGAPL